MTEKKVYTTGDAARLCKVHQQMIVRCFDSGMLKGFQDPNTKLRRIPHDCLVAFMRENNIPLCQERTVFISSPIENGINKLIQIITRFKTAPPSTIAGMQVVCVKDHINQKTEPENKTNPLMEPNECLCIIELEKPDNYIAIKPIESKRIILPNRQSKINRVETVLIIKFNLVASLPLSELQDIEAGIPILQSRLDAMKADLCAFIEWFLESFQEARFMS